MNQDTKSFDRDDDRDRDVKDDRDRDVKARIFQFYSTYFYINLHIQ